MALVTLDIGSSVLQRGERIYVILPDDFNATDPIEHGQRKFRTLYLLHGYYGSAGDWTRLSSIERYAGDHHIAVVMPSAYNSYYVNAKHGLKYFDFIANEVPSIVQRLFPLATARDHNFVAGLSMGGYGAMKLGLTYPERYALVGSLSGALEIEFAVQRGFNDPSRHDHFVSIFGEQPNFEGSPDNLFHLLQTAKSPLPYLYVSCGTEDFLLDSNKKFVAMCNEFNRSVDIEYYPGSHNWEYWDTHIVDVLNKIKLLAK